MRFSFCLVVVTVVLAGALGAGCASSESSSDPTDYIPSSFQKDEVNTSGDQAASLLATLKPAKGTDCQAGVVAEEEKAEATQEKEADAAPTDAAPTDAAPTDAAPTDAAPTDAAPTMVLKVVFAACKGDSEKVDDLTGRLKKAFPASENEDVETVNVSDVEAEVLPMSLGDSKGQVVVARPSEELLLAAFVYEDDLKTAKAALSAMLDAGSE